MNRLYIPEISDTLQLCADWTFSLIHERRNEDVWSAFAAIGNQPVIEHTRVHERALKEFYELRTRPRDADTLQRMEDLRTIIYTPQSVPVTLPAGTVLQVDRIYIRKGASDFSSLSFYIKSTPLAELKPEENAPGFKRGRKRFFARLSDVNNIFYTQVSS